MEHYQFIWNGYKQGGNSHISMDAFAAAVKQEFKKLYGGRYAVNIVGSAAGNGVQKAAADICGAGECLPVRILLDAAYRSYTYGGTGMQEICRNMAALYEKNKNALHRSEDMLKDYKKAEQSICCRLINARMNAGMLSGMPHVLLHDLAIVFYVILDDLRGQLPVSRRMFDAWGTDVFTLKDRAVSNTRERFGSVIRPIASMLMETMPKGLPWPENFLKDAGDAPQLYSVTNEQMYNGSVSILYPGLLDGFAERTGSSFFILPSSVHDVIFLPAENKDNACAWKQLVKSVNAAESAREIILSDNVYYYSRPDGQLLLM